MLYIMLISYAVSLKIASLALRTLKVMAAGDATQTTSVQIMHVFKFSCCIVLQITPACVSLIPVRVLFVIWCVLINW